MKILERKLDREETQRSYKKVVWFYDFWSFLTERKAARYVLEYAEINDGEAIIEVGCGTGVVFANIVQKNPNGKNVGIDLSPDMLAKARKRMKRIERERFELKEGDALMLDFKDSTFDLLINNFMVDLMPLDSFDKLAVEFFRVLKPNGRIVMSNFSFGKKRINKIWYWVAKRFPALLTGCRPVSFGEYLTRAGFHIERTLEISQNTFPTVIIKAVK